MSRITSDLSQAVRALKNGQPVALPTETVYGLAANAHDEQAIRSVFMLKNRPLDHPLIMHVAPEWDLNQWVSLIPDYAQKLIDHFWPGPLTIVLTCRKNQVPASVTGGQNSVAIRSPNHPAFLACLREIGNPLVAPSANPFGKVSPTAALHVADSFHSSDLLIYDGGRCQVGIESTIIDARAKDNFQILRHGVIGETEINQIIAEINQQTEASVRVSGHLKTHYQPNKPLLTFSDDEQLASLMRQYPNKLAIIDHQKPLKALDTYFFAWPQHAKKAAFELYHQLRAADKLPVKAIAIRLPPNDASWLAVRERILKARQQ